MTLFWTFGFIHWFDSFFFFSIWPDITITASAWVMSEYCSEQHCMVPHFIYSHLFFFLPLKSQFSSGECLIKSSSYRWKRFQPSCQIYLFTLLLQRNLKTKQIFNYVMVLRTSSFMRHETEHMPLTRRSSCVQSRYQTIPNETVLQLSGGKKEDHQKQYIQIPAMDLLVSMSPVHILPTLFAPRKENCSSSLHMAFQIADLWLQLCFSG